MTDIVDSQTRSRMMASIRGKNTSPELAIRRYLHARGFRYQLHRKNLPGKPDLVLPKYRLAIFVNGCFWHKHKDCFYASSPASHKTFWKEKLEGNVARDWRKWADLVSHGWRVLVIWECGLKHCSDDLESVVNIITGEDPFHQWPSSPPRTRPTSSN
ncbi:very short patch repair endonuclease [Cobetia amphilecti]|uniref:very short patch repair endonuclease n=1 Tax=Cobetia amphilecti TaxID=1055104 RepID=UPI00329A339B